MLPGVTVFAFHEPSPILAQYGFQLSHSDLPDQESIKPTRKILSFCEETDGCARRMEEGLIFVIWHRDRRQRRAVGGVRKKRCRTLVLGGATFELKCEISISPPKILLFSESTPEFQNLKSLLYISKDFNLLSYCRHNYFN